MGMLNGIALNLCMAFGRIGFFTAFIPIDVRCLSISVFISFHVFKALDLLPLWWGLFLHNLIFAAILNVSVSLISFSLSLLSYRKAIDFWKLIQYSTHCWNCLFYKFSGRFFGIPVYNIILLENMNSLTFLNFY